MTVDRFTRRRQGQPAGGQFAPRSRSDAALALIAPLSDIEKKRLGRFLRDARNMLAAPLTPDARQRVVDFVFTPTPTNWERAYSVIINDRGETVWLSTLNHSDYDTRSRPSGTGWATIPTREQVLIGIELGARNQRGADRP